jgi:putative acetyltransferase
LGSRSLISIYREPPITPEAQELLAQSEALSAVLYPPESRHSTSTETLSDDSARFFIARSDGCAVGCGALVLAAGYGEIKRMFVDSSMRGQGLGRALLEAIETWARTEGLDGLRRETGVRNNEAVALYERSGYKRCGPFGDYQPDPSASSWKSSFAETA